MGGVLARWPLLNTPDSQGDSKLVLHVCFDGRGLTMDFAFSKFEDGFDNALVDFEWRAGPEFMHDCDAGRNMLCLSSLELANPSPHCTFTASNSIGNFNFGLSACGS